MVFACFYGWKKGPIYALPRDFESAKHGYSANSYITALEDCLLSVYLPGMIFMQDNAKIHKVKKTMAWFAVNGILLVNWSPYSPDLNLIEHLWNDLKALVYKIRPDIERVKGGEDAIRLALWEALEEAWEKILEKRLLGLINSMHDRMQAVIDAEGWYTRY